MAKREKVPVSSRALIQRINRKLRADDEMLKISRSTRARFDLGAYYVLNFSMNAIMRKDVDIETFGRSLGVLRPYERVV